ncbi:MAG: protein CapI, partial [Desulfuromonas sp.]
IAKAPYAIYNVGNNQPVALQRFIAAIEQSCGKQAVKEYLDMQPGDVLKTYADISRLKDVIGYQSTTPIEEGVESFVAWYRRYQRGNLV